MKSSEAVNDGFIKACSSLQWNWLEFLPWVTGMTVAEIGGKFRDWIGEIERADGTMDFRWALIIPRDAKSRELYVLIGGLSSGSWWFWTRRWAAIMGDRQLRAGLIYGFGLPGAGFSWVFYHLFVYAYMIPRICRECLQIPARDWYLHVAKALTGAAATYGLAWIAIVVPSGYSLVAIVVAFAVATLGFAAAARFLIGPDLNSTLASLPAMRHLARPV